MSLFVTNSMIYNAIAALKTVMVSTLKEILVSESQTQTDIDNAVAVVTGLLTDIGTQNGVVLTDLGEIQTALSNGQPVDLSKLDTIVASVGAVQASLDTAVASLTAVAAPPVTPPAA
jgi:hypothetical protein